MPAPSRSLPEDDNDAAAVAHARRVLESSREGVLCFEDHTLAVKFVADGADGRLVLNVPAAALLATEHTLMTPEESDDALQLLITPEQIEESALTDRWQAYHGAPAHIEWCEAWIESARHGAWVFDGEAIMAPNRLAADEAALCKALNADKAALSRLCQRYAGVPVPTPTCVGVDQRGLYVRAAFGVVRVAFEDEVGDAADVRRRVSEMLGAC